MAQGETHLIRQSKEWLSEHGVSLEALQRAASGAGADKNVSRSKTLILVRGRP